jgi:circadian clock protein KaiC
MARWEGSTDPKYQFTPRRGQRAACPCLAVARLLAKRKPPRESCAPHRAKSSSAKCPAGARHGRHPRGGIPEFSFNIIAGAPGCGKTTLAHQILFANATAKKPALYFTVLGEPAMKMLRYQQQYSFFDESKLGKAIRFINLAEVVWKRIWTRSSGDRQAGCGGRPEPRSGGFLPHSGAQGSAQHERAGDADLHPAPRPVPHQLGSHDVSRRRICPRRDAGQSGLHRRRRPDLALPSGGAEFRGAQTANHEDAGTGVGAGPAHPSHQRGRVAGFLADAGLDRNEETPNTTERLSIGIPELDKMLGGGILEGDSLLIAGPSGTGKSALATQFIAEGLRNGEPGIIAVFEERPNGYTDRAASFGLNLKTPQEKGNLEILYLRPLDLSVDETMQALLEAIARVGAKRLAIDSLVGLKWHSRRTSSGLRESLYRMIGALTGAGITILSTVEVEDTFTAMPFSHYAISFLTDDIIRLRYVEIDGQLRKVLVVVKMRGGNHSKDIREYVITDKGVVVIHPRQTE